jgi:hypothetical protein
VKTSRDKFLNLIFFLNFIWLELNGDALHASMGLPPALNVTKAKVGKFEIIVSNFSHLLI